MVSNRFGWVRQVVGAAAVTVGVALVTVPAAVVPGAVTSTVALVDWPGAGASSTGGAAPGRGSAGAASDPTDSTASIDSDPATRAESTGVVLIDTVLGYQGAAGAGTGIVLTSDGEVATNYHVVEGATSITVTVAATGVSYDATVVGHSTSTDVALLKLSDASGLATATVDDDTVALGDSVTAVGNAGGTGTLTAADGTVTDLSSAITTASEGSVAAESLTGLLETDADVVPGDSGGPLVDGEGEVVGIDTAASDGTSSATIDGYAIPIEDVLTVVRQILSGTGTATVQVGGNAFLGVQVSDSTATDPWAGSGGGYGYGSGAAYGTASGASVAGVVDGSPAADAGLAAGDTITAVGSTPVASAAALSTALAGHAVGDRVVLSWTDTAGQTQQATLTLAASPTA